MDSHSRDIYRPVLNEDSKLIGSLLWHGGRPRVHLVENACGGQVTLSELEDIVRALKNRGE